MLLNAECSCLYIIQLVPFSSEIWRAFCAPSLRLDYLNCTWDFAVQIADTAAATFVFAGRGIAFAASTLIYRPALC